MRLSSAQTPICIKGQGYLGTIRCFLCAYLRAATSSSYPWTGRSTQRGFCPPAVRRDYYASKPVDLRAAFSQFSHMYYPQFQVSARLAAYRLLFDSFVRPMYILVYQLRSLGFHISH